MGAGAVRETTHDAEHGGGDETQFIAALRAGEESAFVELIDRYHAGLVRLAQVFVRDAALAEEVVQEAWLGVLRRLDRFEARSSFKRWISSILINQRRLLVGERLYPHAQPSFVTSSRTRPCTTCPAAGKPSGKVWITTRTRSSCWLLMCAS